METVQFAEVCKRIEMLWPQRRLNQEIVQEWHKSFGTWAEYAATMRAVGRLAEEDDRAPGLAKIIQTYRQIAGKPRRTRQEDERAEHMRDFPRLVVIADNWIRIQRGIRRSKEVREMFHAMWANLEDPANPTNAEGAMIAECLLDEIRARGVDVERRGAKARPVGEFAPIGAIVPQAAIG